MRRPLINRLDTAAPLTIPSVGGGGVAVKLSPLLVDRVLLSKRTEAYVKAMTQLDAGIHHADGKAIASLMETLRAEFPELRASDLPLGIVARCHLGEPHEVHTLDCTGDIVRHYKRHESLPPNLERARTLALHPGYAFIEVYLTTLRAIRDDGSPVILTA